MRAGRSSLFRPIKVPSATLALFFGVLFVQLSIKSHVIRALCLRTCHDLHLAISDREENRKVLGENYLRCLLLFLLLRVCRTRVVRACHRLIRSRDIFYRRIAFAIFHARFSEPERALRFADKEILQLRDCSKCQVDSCHTPTPFRSKVSRTRRSKSNECSQHCDFYPRYFPRNFVSVNFYRARFSETKYNTD